MRFRNLALLAVIATVMPFVYNTVSFYFLVKTTQSHSKIIFSSVIASTLPVLAEAIFFFFLYFEALGQIKAETRAKAAIASSILMGLDAARSLFRFVVYVIALLISPSHVDPHDSILLANGLFQLGWDLFLLAFLIAFSTNRRMIASHIIPKVAGVLSVFTIFQAVWSGVQFHNGSFALGWSNYAVFLFGWVAFLVFYVLVWKIWKPDLSIHENVVS